jgi:hypothetical protein
LALRLTLPFDRSQSLVHLQQISVSFVEAFWREEHELALSRVELVLKREESCA